MESNIAILWDIENVTPRANSLFIEGIRDYTESLGRVVASYAYADWSKPGFKNLGPLLAAHHFSMAHIPYRNRRNNKNGSDMQLVSDAFDLLRFYDHIGTYILITGDSDFRPVLLTLRRTGKKIHIICDIKTASQDLLAIADSFVDYREVLPNTDDDDESDSNADDDESEENTKNESEKQSHEYWFERLAEAARILEKEGKSSNMGSVKIRMKVLNQGFDESRLGFKRWSTFVAAAVKRGFVTMEEGDKGTRILPGNNFKQEGGTLQAALKALLDELDKLDDGKPQFHTYSVLSSRMKERGINIRSVGFNQFKKFVSSAEARGLVETKVERLLHYVKKSI